MTSGFTQTRCSWIRYFTLYYFFSIRTASIYVTIFYFSSSWINNFLSIVDFYILLSVTVILLVCTYFLTIFIVSPIASSVFVLLSLVSRLLLSHWQFPSSLSLYCVCSLSCTNLWLSLCLPKFFHALFLYLPWFYLHLFLYTVFTFTVLPFHYSTLFTSFSSPDRHHSSFAFSLHLGKHEYLFCSRCIYR